MYLKPLLLSSIIEAFMTKYAQLPKWVNNFNCSCGQSKLKHIYEMKGQAYITCGWVSLFFHLWVSCFLSCTACPKLTNLVTTFISCTQ